MLNAATVNGAKALGVKKGSLIKDFDADIIGFCLPDKIEEVEDIYGPVMPPSAGFVESEEGAVDNE